MYCNYGGAILICFKNKMTRLAFSINGVVYNISTTTIARYILESTRKLRRHH